MHKDENNYAFIDTQNIYLAIKEQGWLIDWKKFRIYLKEKYKVKKAFLFIGYLESNKRFYKFLRQSDYQLIFKEVLNVKGEIKGNIDAELVLQAMIELKHYKKAIIATNDGDFACLIKHLYKENKFKILLTPNIKKCSKLLRKVCKKRIQSLLEMKNKLSYERSRTS